MTSTYTAWLTLLLVLLCGCDKGASPEAVETGPPPQTVQFPRAAATYTYYDVDGDRQTARSFDDVPETVNAAAIVYVGEKTRPPQGKTYMLDLTASDDRIGTARLVDEEEAKEFADAAWAGDAAGSRSVLLAYEMATADEEEVAATVRRAPSARPGAKKRAPIESVQTIEIVGVTDGSTKSWQPQELSGEAAFGWKPVTMYMTQTCGVCTRARRWLKANNVPYRELDLDASDGVRQEWSRVVRRNGLSNGVPTFVIGQDKQVMQGWSSKRFVSIARR